MVTSTELSSFTLLLGILLTLIFLILFRRKRKSEIPGPTGLPIIGNVHQLMPNPHLTLSKWAEEYGPVVKLQLAHKSAILISCPKLMKEIFGHVASTGKFKADTYLLLSKGERGIVNTVGRAWQEQRQFCGKNLKTLGFGNRSLEPLILSEAQELVEWILKQNESGIENNEINLNMTKVLQPATANTLWTIVADERFDLENTFILNLLVRCFDDLIFTATHGLIFFPWLKDVAPGWSGYNAVVRSIDELHGFVESRFEQHQKSIIPDSPRDLIDTYLDQMNLTQDPASSFHGKEGWQNCIASVVELLMAGGKTMAFTLSWMLNYLCQHPDVQRKVHEELDEVVGHSREPSIQDKRSMPYLEAVILETLRYSSLFPVGVIHELLENISCNGYGLEKGDLLIPNMYHVHHSKDIWGDPEQFRPERFLGESNNLKQNVIPFQPGRRSCFGEALAWDIFFLFGAKLLQHFEVYPEKNKPRSEYMEPDFAYLLPPKPVNVVMKARI